jgi:DME family drug/metabolite transporter
MSATIGRAAFTGRLLLRGHPLGNIDPLILSQSRTTVSCILLFLALLLRRGGHQLRVTRNDFGKMALLGIFGLAAANYFYYLAIQKTNVATAITVQYTAPIWVLLYMVLRGLQKPTIQRMTAVALAVVGIAVAIGVFTSGGVHLNPIGVTAATLAAFSCAFYNISGHKVMGKHEHWIVVFYMTFTASLFWLLLNPPWRIVSAHYSSAQWMFLAFFAVVSMLIPFSFYFAGLKYLEPTRAIVASCLEPIFAILIAAMALHETVRPSQALGMLMVLAAIVMVQLPEARGTTIETLQTLQ